MLSHKLNLPLIQGKKLYLCSRKHSNTSSDSVKILVMLLDVYLS